MLDPRRHAAALLAVLTLSLPATAPAQGPTLLAQIEDATPTPTAESQPPLSEDPPGDLDGDGGGDGNGDGSGGGREDGDDGRDERESLPETGVEAGLIALLGLGLIASGSGLRLTLRRAA